MGLKNLSNNQTIATIIGVLIGSLITWIISQKQPVGKIEYSINPVSDLINLPTSKLNEAKLFNQKTVTDVSSIDIFIYNRTGSVYKEVKFAFKINKNQKENPILIGESFIGPKSFPSDSSIHQTSKTAEEINYTVDIINPSDDPTKYFKARFIFLGKNPPKIDVFAVGDGLEIENYNPNKITRVGWILILSISIFYLVIIGLFLLYFNRKDRVIRKLKHTKYIEILQAYLNQIDLNELKQSPKIQSDLIDKFLSPEMSKSTKNNVDKK